MTTSFPPEGFPDQEPTPPEFNLPPIEDVTRFTQLVGLHDDARHTYLSASRLYRLKPGEPGVFSSMTETCQLMVDTFKGLATELSNVEEDSTVRTTMLQGVIRQDLVEQCDLLGSLNQGVDCNYFTQRKPTDEHMAEIMKILGQNADTWDEFLRLVVTTYASNIQDNTQHFVDEVSDLEEVEQKPTKWQVVGRHALDVLKTTAGVAGGIALGAIAVRRMFKF